MAFIKRCRDDDAGEYEIHNHASSSSLSRSGMCIRGIAVASGLNAQNNPEIDADGALCNWLKREAKAGAYYC